ncbi:hypothetical protein ATE84_1126 [Aquimarina sp. MAR_2010_214]|uniref:hypothetical protein n=1 Tax=Aquimarina sp. MAR_2010_214 TaxID=1250026 RepID=UPI000C7049A5|nr:hypothetical protein [Aquimarina sp. MAR_2010_214]PKV49109.1 hypothetical protein ATE84_1126 [Aquimarina sp. MAR_2010_214]
MAFRTLYKTLFHIDIHHSYFLNDGEDAFLDMTDAEKKEQLRKYMISDYMDVVPAMATQKELKNHKMVFRTETGGFRVLCKVNEEDDKYRTQIPLGEELKLTFYLYANDYLFDNYTALTKEENKLYYFSNIKPDTEANPYSYIPVSSSNDLITDDFLLTEESTQALVFALEQENKRVDTNARLSSIADLEAADLSTDEGKLIINQAIQKERGRGLLGIIQLYMQGDNDLDVTEIDAADPEDVKDFILDPVPEFKLHFDNKKTIWKYINVATEVELETTVEKPLTIHGFIEIVPEDDLTAPLPVDIDKYLFPNPTAHSIKLVTNENTNTIITYSEIYI